MDSRVVRLTYKKKKSVVGIPRIPKTFVFDKNLPKEEYLKYINPDNIIPESIEIATKVFSNYRKKVGPSNLNLLSKQEYPLVLGHKASLPLLESERFSNTREIATFRDGTQTCEGSMIKNLEERQLSFKKLADKSKPTEIIQDSVNEYKPLIRDLTSFSLAHDNKNQEDRPYSSPYKGGNSVRSPEESFAQPKFFANVSHLNAHKKAKENTKGLSEHTFNNKQDKNLNNEVKGGQKKKGKLVQNNEINELDDTQEIVRKTNAAVRNLSRRTEQVKREVKNFEEIIKTKMKENGSAPLNSLRAVNLVRDYVWNDEEFQKLKEEEELDEARKRREKEVLRSLKPKEKKRANSSKQKGSKSKEPQTREDLEKEKEEVSPEPKMKEKKRANSSRQIETYTEMMQSTMMNKFGHSGFNRMSPRDLAITISKEEMDKINRQVHERLHQREEELKKQLDVEVKIHEKIGVFSSENNLFRINSMHYTKLIKEKDKVKNELIRELKNIKYKEREGQMKTLQTFRSRPIQSARLSHYDNEQKKEKENLGEVNAVKEEKDELAARIKEVLTKPVKDNAGNKQTDFVTHLKRLDDLKKKYTTTAVEHVNNENFHNL